MCGPGQGGTGGHVPGFKRAETPRVRLTSCSAAIALYIASTDSAPAGVRCCFVILTEPTLSQRRTELAVDDRRQGIGIAIANLVPDC